MRVQLHAVQDSNILMPPQTVQAMPPSKQFPAGRYDTALIVDTDEAETAGISGKYMLSFICYK